MARTAPGPDAAAASGSDDGVVAATDSETAPSVADGGEA